MFNETELSVESSFSILPFQYLKHDFNALQFGKAQDEFEREGYICVTKCKLISMAIYNKKEHPGVVMKV